jgi:transposase
MARSGAALELSDTQWERVRLLIPAANQRGRPRIAARRVLNGILYRYQTGCRWQDLPARYGSGATCWRRWREWQAAGAWPHIWQAVVDTLDVREQARWASLLAAGAVRPPHARLAPAARHHA